MVVTLFLMVTTSFEFIRWAITIRASALVKCIGVFLIVKVKFLRGVLVHSPLVCDLRDCPSIPPVSVSYLVCIYTALLVVMYIGLYIMYWLHPLVMSLYCCVFIAIAVELSICLNISCSFSPQSFVESVNKSFLQRRR